ncbi:Trehalose phosphorylase [Dictyocoela muelleri]|nr:Trehalose phosphorylase [Dictyocoela muelleri]
MNREIFMGVAMDISEKRDRIDIYVSINDGFYTIDSETITYEIVKGEKFEVKKDIKTTKKICIPGINCFSVALEGKIIIPGFMSCDHVYEDFVANEMNNGQLISNSVINYEDDRINWFNRLNIFNTKEVQVCSKCKKIMVKNLLNRILGSAPDSDEISIYENSYNTKLEDCNYEIMGMILSELSDTMLFWIKQYLIANSLKLVAIGMPVSLYRHPVVLSKLKSRLWNDFDALPCFFTSINQSIEYVADSFARKASNLIGFDNIVRLSIGPLNKVEVDAKVIDFCSLVDYQNYLNEFPGVISDILNISRQRLNEKNLLEKNLLEKILPEKNLKNKKIIFIGATPQGGGVALMRHAHMRFYKLLGMDVKWYVTFPVSKVYKITKTRFHNVLQGVSKDEITSEEIDIYEKWIEININRFWKKQIFKDADIIVLDDHQTSGFANIIKKINKNAKIIYRSHIQIRSELNGKCDAFTKVWNYISNNLKVIDLFISHPLKEFVPDDFDFKKVVYLPPSTDPLDGLNKKMDSDIRNYYFQKFEELCIKYNQPILKEVVKNDLGCNVALIKDSSHFSLENEKNQDLSPNDCNSTLTYKRCPYIVQIARFDPSKGIKDTINSFLKLLERIGTEHTDVSSPLYNLKLVLIGHGSVDDPEGRTVYSETVDYIQKTGSKHIIAVQVPPNDQILNCILSNAKVCLQLSISEGFEIKVSEAILKNIPVIVYNSGGLPLQVSHGITGYIVNRGDIDQVATHLEYLLKTPEFKINMRNYIKYNKIYSTPFQIMGWLFIFKKVLEGENGNEEVIYDKIRDIYFKELRK